MIPKPPGPDARFARGTYVALRNCFDESLGIVTDDPVRNWRGETLFITAVIYVGPTSTIRGVFTPENLIELCTCEANARWENLFGQQAQSQAA